MKTPVSTKSPTKQPLCCIPAPPIAVRGSYIPRYRYFFNGQEADNEVYGEGSVLGYEYRMHDTRIGRFWSVDPLASKFPWNSPYAFAENRVVDGRELEGKEVLLIGKQEDASFVLSGSGQAGIAITPNGVYGYGSGAIGLETNISVATQISITYFPTMPSIKNAEGWGWIGGFTGGELATITANLAYSDGYYGLNISFGIGGGLLPISGAAYATYTKATPISDEAARDYAKILKESRRKVVKQINDIDNHVSTLTKTNKELNNSLTNSKLSHNEKKSISKRIDKNRSDLDKLNKDKTKLNNILESIDQGIRTLDSK